MSSKSKVVLGIYKTRSQVESAVNALKAEGFVTTDISVLMPESTGSQDFAHMKGTKAPEGAVTGGGAGAVVGGAIGGIGGALVGIGMPEYEAKRYEGYIKEGGILLSVHTDDSNELTRAKKCLDATGAKDISSTGEVKGDWTSPSYNTKDTPFTSTM